MPLELRFEGSPFAENYIDVPVKEPSLFVRFARQVDRLSTRLVLRYKPGMASLGLLVVGGLMNDKGLMLASIGMAMGEALTFYTSSDAE